MDDIVGTRPPPPDWIEALARSDAQVAAGQAVPSGLVRQRLRDSIARLEGRPEGDSPREVEPPRR
jgi:hypothetical protein